MITFFSFVQSLWKNCVNRFPNIGPPISQNILDYAVSTKNPSIAII